MQRFFSLIIEHHGAPECGFIIFSARRTNGGDLSEGRPHLPPERTRSLAAVLAALGLPPAGRNWYATRVLEAWES